MIVLRRPYDAEQKEFSRLTKVIKGVRNPNVARRALSIKLTREIKGHVNELDQRVSAANMSNTLRNQELEDKLKTIAENQGMLVHSARIDPGPSNSIVRDLKPENFAPGEKLVMYNPPVIVNDLKNKLQGRTEFISHPILSGDERLAHELGHMENAKPLKHPISWINTKVANSEKTREGIEKTIKNQILGKPDYKSRGWWNTLGRYLAAKSINHEESLASTRGIKILRKIGATPEEIEKARANLKLDTATYEPAGSIYWLTSLRNTIRPK